MSTGIGEHPLPRTTNPIILQHALWMTREGYKNSTIKSTVKTLKAVSNRCNINNPTELKTYLATATYTPNRKHKIICDANRLYRQLGIKWERPRSRPVETPTFLPIEEEINQLIGGLGPKLAAFMMTVKDTYARAGEVFNLKWTDLELNTNTVSITPEKGSKPRRIKLKARTVAALLARTRTHQYIFQTDKTTDIEKTYDDFYRNFAKQRARIAERLQNPRIRRISFKTLRHYGGTLEYARTKDLLYVKERLGHRSLSSTLKYTHLVPFDSDEWLCKVASTKQERTELIEAGFTFVSKQGEEWYFRKRK
jgi:integrase